MKLYIIGVGPGGERHLTAEAREHIAGADLVLAGARLYALFSPLNAKMRECGLADIPSAVRAAVGLRAVAVLVSGDSGFFSLGKSLPEKLKDVPQLEIVYLPGLSSLQYLAAKSGLSYEDALCLSLHGRSGSVLPYVSYNPKVFVLTGGAIKARNVISELVEAGLGAVRVLVGQNLGGAEQKLDDAERQNLGGTGMKNLGGAERQSSNGTGRQNLGNQERWSLDDGEELILDATAQELAGRDFPDLTCLFLLNANFTNPQQRIADSDFIRGQAPQKTVPQKHVPMTKWAIRALSLAALNIQPGDIVYDIGAGTGAMAVELARKARAGTVYALERDAAALALLTQNREKFGAFNLHILQAEAPSGLAELPAPDKVFIGGSGGKLREILQAVLQKNAAARLLLTAVTLETLSEAVASFKEHGLEPELACINAAFARPLGGYNLMQAENPVYIISGGGHAG